MVKFFFLFKCWFLHWKEKVASIYQKNLLQWYVCVNYYDYITTYNITNLFLSHVFMTLTNVTELISQSMHNLGQNIAGENTNINCLVLIYDCKWTVCHSIRWRESNFLPRDRNIKWVEYYLYSSHWDDIICLTFFADLL